MIKTARLLVAIAVVLATASSSRADIGAIVLEPISGLGYFTRVGHAGTYLSNVCQDGSPVKMRLCLPGESGSVVSTYAPLSENENYDWAIVPFEEYMHGFAAPGFAPMIGTRKLQSAIERYNFGPLFSRALKATRIGELPEGQWKAALATRFVRSIYIFTIETTAADDAAIVAAFNAAPNRSQFNFFYRNCSNRTKSVFELMLPRVNIGDRTSGVSMVTPKGLAKALVDLALNNPDLHLRVRRYAQIPGTFSRSRDVLFPMENTYKSLGFAPYWYFGGFREVALVAMFYHEVISPFSMLESSRNFMSPAASQLTLEQRHLRQRQDEVRLALARAQDRGFEWLKLSALNASVFRRLGEIRKDKQAEVIRVAGSKAQWQALDGEFQSMVRALHRQRFVPEELQRHLAQFAPDGSLSEQLLRYFEARGEFYVDDAGRGPWISLPLVDGETLATGLSRSQILAGDPRVAVLILATVIDYNLYQTEARREDMAYMDEMFTLFRQASVTIGRQAGGQ